MENYIVINGKKAELTKEQLEKLGIKIEKDIFNPEAGERYYSIGSMDEVSKTKWDNDSWDKDHKRVANCCTDENIMQQRSWHESLNRLLWRFSMQNGMQNFDWDNPNQNKFHICYNHYTDEFTIGTFLVVRPQTICFISREIAQEAIDAIVKPFMEKHPDFVW